MEDGPPMFRQGFHVSRPTRFHFINPFVYGAITLYGHLSTFQTVPLEFIQPRRSLRAAPRSLAATWGISVDFFSSGYLDVSVPRVRLSTLCIQIEITFLQSWVSPFGNPRIKASLQAPRGLSHATTSFIASYRLGIHRMRLFT